MLLPKRLLKRYINASFIIHSSSFKESVRMSENYFCSKQHYGTDVGHQEVISIIIDHEITELIIDNCACMR